MANKITGSMSLIQSILAEILSMKEPPTIVTVELYFLKEANEGNPEASSL